MPPTARRGATAAPTTARGTAARKGRPRTLAIKATLRERQKRNILATLFFSQGLPMLLAGDEFGRTQNGNNNAYCQDNEISWVDWDLDGAGHALYAFVQKLTRLRQDYPILRRERFLSGHYNQELDVKDVTWLKPNGDETG